MIWWMSMMTMDATIQPFLGSTPYTLSARSNLRHQQVPSCTACLQSQQFSLGPSEHRPEEHDI